MAQFTVVKRYGHDLGLSACFRQWRAPETHCSKLHGYALGFTLTFTSDTLDHRNWVISFGELKEVKKWLEETFDHKTLVAKDDPMLQWFAEAEQAGILQLVVVDHVGMEKFAELAYDKIVEILGSKMVKNNVRLVSVAVAEHNGNAVVYTPTSDKIKKLDAQIKKLEKKLTDPLLEDYFGKAISTWQAPTIKASTSGSVTAKPYGTLMNDYDWHRDLGYQGNGKYNF